MNEFSRKPPVARYPFALDALEFFHRRWILQGIRAVAERERHAHEPLHVSPIGSLVTEQVHVGRADIRALATVLDAPECHGRAVEYKKIAGSAQFLNPPEPCPLRGSWAG